MESVDQSHERGAHSCSQPASHPPLSDLKKLSLTPHVCLPPSPGSIHPSTRAAPLSVPINSSLICMQHVVSWPAINVQLPHGEAQWRERALRLAVEEMDLMLRQATLMQARDHQQRRMCTCVWCEGVTSCCAVGGVVTVVSVHDGSRWCLHPSLRNVTARPLLNSGRQSRCES